MGIDNMNWQKRVASRTDLTGRLTHLTKPQVDISQMNYKEVNLSAVNNLIDILKSRIIYGSTTQSGYIIGNKNAVCFQDTTIYGLIQNVEYEKNHVCTKLRYCGIGLSFYKKDMYCEGARPVIYEDSEVAKSFLPPEQWWRIVKTNFYDEEDIVDWTHEREWRMQGDFNFSSYMECIHIILYDPACFHYFIDNCPSDILRTISGITTLTTVLY